MIFVRHYTEADLDEVKRLHERQGLSYELPDLHADTMLVQAVIEEEGTITHAAFLRKTAEAYWLFDPTRQSRKQRLGRLVMLHKELTQIAKNAGFEDVHAWLPPELAGNKCLDLTMKRFGWERMHWQPYRYPL